jgi:predicted transcriptional regulator of viral defense system
MAAVLACGKTAVASHRSAAAVWRLLPEPPDGAPVDITIRSGFREGGPSVRVHRASTLGVDETTLREGVPVTTPARTLLDLAGSPERKRVEQALAAALRRVWFGEGRWRSSWLATPEDLAVLPCGLSWTGIPIRP